MNIFQCPLLCLVFGCPFVFSFAHLNQTTDAQVHMAEHYRSFHNLRTISSECVIPLTDIIGTFHTQRFSNMLIMYEMWSREYCLITIAGLCLGLKLVISWFCNNSQQFFETSALVVIGLRRLPPIMHVSAQAVLSAHWKWCAPLHPRGHHTRYTKKQKLTSTECFKEGACQKTLVSLA